MIAAIGINTILAKDTKIYLNPVDSFNLRYSLFSLINTDYKIEQNNRLEMVVYYTINKNNMDSIDSIDLEMDSATKRIIKNFDLNPPIINIYFGDISDCIFSQNKIGDDFLNIVRADFSIKNSQFKDILADAFDCDFCTGTISDTKFITLKSLKS